MTDIYPQCCSMHDPSGRRGIWYAVENGELIIIAGREGDDCSVRVKAGELVTVEAIKGILDCLDVGAWMQEDYGPNCRVPTGKFEQCPSGGVIDRLQPGQCKHGKVEEWCVNCLREKVYVR